MKTPLILLSLLAPLTPAFAQSVKLGELSIENPWARASPKGADVGAGYLTIRNDGAASDTLTGVGAGFADVQVHEMKMSNGVMEMRELTNGLEIPAHGSVKLAPGADHLMFVGLKKPLVKGETVKITLTFRRAGAAVVELPVQGVGAAAPGGAMNSMKGM